MTRLLRQKRQEAELGAAVALPKRMDGVQFGKKVSRFFCESLFVQAAQIIAGRQSGEERIHLVIDELGKAERIAAF